MEQRLCKYDNKPIPEGKRAGAIFCSPECGWRYRNRKNAEHQKEKKITDRRLKKNHNIIKDLVERGFVDVSKETLIILGFDPNYYTGIGEYNSEKRTTEYKIFEYSFIIQNERCRLKKSNNGRI